MKYSMSPNTGTTVNTVNQASDLTGLRFSEMTTHAVTTVITNNVRPHNHDTNAR